MPYVISLYGDTPVRALVVEDALYCGSCRPRPDPVELPELNEAASSRDM
jgi:hypothetical protein